MNLYSKLLVTFFFIPAILFGSEIKKHEKTKTINREFNVNSNATVYIRNKYGAVNVSTWNENRVEIEVKITVKGGSLDKVNEKLNSIQINFKNAKDLVEARTQIESKRFRWGWWSTNNNINYKINYYIKMPITNNADLHNKYGNIELDVIEGKTNIDCDYGSIQVEKLLNNSNTITLDYCNNSIIQYMKYGNVNADYSKITIKESQKLKISADYTEVKIGKVNQINFNSDYGSIAVDDVESIEGDSDYAGMRIGTIRKNLKINTDYGGLRIKNLVKGFDYVTVDGSYAGVKIGTSGDNNFNFVVDLSYAGFKYPDELVKTFKAIRKTSKKYYEGVFGKKESDSKIKIKSSYGGVSIKLND